MDTKQSPVKGACNKHLQNGVRQFWHNLKKKYFDGVPLSEVPTKSPVSSTTNKDWLELVEHWKSPHSIVSLFFKIEVFTCTCICMYIVSNSTFHAKDQ
jgi:hypothetical protein